MLATYQLPLELWESIAECSLAEIVVGLAMNLEREWNRPIIQGIQSREADHWAYIPVAFYDAVSLTDAEADSKMQDGNMSRGLMRATR